MHPPLIVSRDPGLLDALTRLAAAAGVAPVVVDDVAPALRSWIEAPLVLVGLDAADDLAAARPPRRERVLVVTSGPASDGVFRTALDLGAETVVELPDDMPVLTEVLTDAGEEDRPAGRVVGVLGGSGGAGASTFACALGQVAARAGPVLVVDTDPLGAGLDRVLGLEATTGVRWGDLGQTAGRLGARSLREAVPSRSGLGVLTWETGSVSALSPGTVRECLSAGRRGHDLVVVDLPRASDPLADEIALRCDLVQLVVRPTVSSLSAAVRLVARFPDPGRLGLVVRGSGIGPRQIARLTGVPVLAEMSDQRRLAECVDLGLGPVRSHRGALARAAARVLAEVAT